LAGAAAAVAVAKNGSAMAATQTKTSDIVVMNALGLSAAIHANRISCVEVMTAYLDHIARLNPKVNAIVALQDRAGLLTQARERDAQLVRGEYQGWMHGFPHAVKDIQPVKGIPMTMGS